MEHFRERAEGQDLHRNPDWEVRILRVRAPEVFNKLLLGAIGLFLKLLKPLGVVERVVEVPRIDMAERAVSLAEGVGNCGTDVDFQHLQGLGDEVAEREVEVVGGPHLLEGNARPKDVSLLLEGETVSAEAVLVDVREEGLGGDRVSNDQAAGGQLRESLRCSISGTDRGHNGQRSQRTGGQRTEVNS